MSPNKPTNGSLDNGLLLWGFTIGIIVGCIATLFKAPKSSTIRQQLTETSEGLRHKLETVVPPDPIEVSLAEGKEAARRRQSELGLRNN